MYTLKVLSIYYKIAKSIHVCWHCKIFRLTQFSSDCATLKSLAILKINKKMLSMSGDSFQSMFKYMSFDKSADVRYSEQFRNEGKKRFREGKFYGAIAQYNKALMCARNHKKLAVYWEIDRLFIWSWNTSSIACTTSSWLSRTFHVTKFTNYAIVVSDAWIWWGLRRIKASFSDIKPSSFAESLQ